MNREDATPDARRSFRHGANLIVLALLNLQDEHGLTDLEMISVLNEHQKTLLGYLVRDQHASQEVTP